MKKKIREFFYKLEMRKLYYVLYFALLMRIMILFKYVQSGYFVILSVVAISLYYCVKKAHDKIESKRRDF